MQPVERVVLEIQVIMVFRLLLIQVRVEVVAVGALG
jgi:hypothetical protein